MCGTHPESYILILEVGEVGDEPIDLTLIPTCSVALGSVVNLNQYVDHRTNLVVPPTRGPNHRGHIHVRILVDPETTLCEPLVEWVGLYLRVWAWEVVHTGRSIVRTTLDETEHG